MDESTPYGSGSQIKRWRCSAEIPGGVLLGSEIPERPLDLFLGQVHYCADLADRDPVLPGVQQEVQRAIWHAEVELLVGDHEAVGVRARRPLYDLPDDPKVFGQLV